MDQRIVLRAVKELEGICVGLVAFATLVKASFIGNGLSVHPTFTRHFDSEYMTEAYKAYKVPVAFCT